MIMEEIDDEYIEQLAAQIAVLACELPRLFIKQAVKNATVALTRKPKSKIEYNNERVRDVKQCKPKTMEIAKISTSIEKGDVYGEIELDAIPYLRNYDMRAFKAMLKNINPSFTSFDRIRKIDLLDQRVGDEGLGALCSGLRSSPVETISLVRNGITDIGLVDHLSKILRSLFELRELYINDNLITDVGIESLFLPDTFSPSLRLINISRNDFTAKSAQYIGSMFSMNTVSTSVNPNAIPTVSSVAAAMASAVAAMSVDGSVEANPYVLKPKTCSLEAVFAGGILNNRVTGEGDKFVRILCGHLLTPNARPIKALHVPDMNLSDSSGLRCIAALISISPALITVNISRNAITSSSTKSFLYLSLMLNKDLQNLMMGQCGLEYSDLKSFELIRRKNNQLRHAAAAAQAEADAKQAAANALASGVMDRYRLQSLSETKATGNNAMINAELSANPSVVKIGNVLTWHEKVQAGLMIAKEVSRNEFEKFEMNKLLYNAWQATKPVVTPDRIIAPHSYYVELKRAENKSPDPLFHILKAERTQEQGSSPPETPLDGSPAEAKYLPGDIEISLRSSMLFADYVDMFLEQDRQLALTFMRKLTPDEIQVISDKVVSESVKMKGKSKKVKQNNSKDSADNSISVNEGMTAENIAKIGIVQVGRLQRSNSGSSVGSVASEISTLSNAPNFLNPTANVTAVCIHGKNEGILTTLVEKYLEIIQDWEAKIAKRKTSSTMSKLFMTVCVDKYVQSMKQRSNKKRVTTGWAAKSNKSAVVSPATLAMAIEDYHSSLYELSTCMEESMARTHQALLLCINNALSNPPPVVAEPKQKARSIKQTLRASMKNVKPVSNVNLSVHYAISDTYNYRSIDLAGYYVSCVCHAIPRERLRVIETTKKEIVEQRIAESVKVRDEANSDKKAVKFIVGPRFRIYTKANPRPKEKSAEELAAEKATREAEERRLRKKKRLLGDMAENLFTSLSTKFGLFNTKLSAKTAAEMNKYDDPGSEESSVVGGVTGKKSSEVVAAGQNSVPTDIAPKHSKGKKSKDKLDGHAASTSIQDATVSHAMVAVTNKTITVHPDGGVSISPIVSMHEHDISLRDNTIDQEDGSVMSRSVETDDDTLAPLGEMHAHPPKLAGIASASASSTSLVLRVPSEDPSESQEPTYKSKYFKVPTVYKRPPSEANSSDNASLDELHFLCAESLNALDVALARNNRIFLINMYANVIWNTYDNSRTKTNRVMGVSAFHFDVPTGPNRNRSISSAAAPVGNVGDGGNRPRAASTAAPVADGNVGIGALTRGRSASHQLESAPSKLFPHRESSALELSSPAVTHPYVMYAEIECHHSESNGSIERIDIWRTKVLFEERKRSLFENRLRYHEEMQK